MVNTGMARATVRVTAKRRRRRNRSNLFYNTSWKGGRFFPWKFSLNRTVRRLRLSQWTPWPNLSRCVLIRYAFQVHSHEQHVDTGTSSYDFTSLLDRCVCISFARVLHYVKCSQIKLALKRATEFIRRWTDGYVHRQQVEDRRRCWENVENIRRRLLPEAVENVAVTFLSLELTMFSRVPRHYGTKSIFETINVGKNSNLAESLSTKITLLPGDILRIPCR